MAFPMAFPWLSYGLPQDFAHFAGPAMGTSPRGFQKNLQPWEKKTNMYHSFIYIYSHFWSLIMGYDGILTKFCILISLES